MSFLKFEQYQINKKKTINVEVRNNDGELLGDIHWRSGWRRYVFEISYGGLEFDSSCLKEISDYLNKLMKEWKDAIQQKKEQ